MAIDGLVQADLVEDVVDVLAGGFYAPQVVDLESGSGKLVRFK